MTGVNKLISLGVSLVVLALFITTIITPILNDIKLQDTVYMVNEDGKPLTESRQLVENVTNGVQGIEKQGINVTGVKTFNLIISLFPLFLTIGGLLVIFRTFKNRG